MIYFGIDISKNDFHVFSEGHSRCFKQSKTGFKALVSWAAKLAAGREMVFVMEATGVYHLRLASWLFEQNYQVEVVNPQRIHHHAKASLSRVKSDTADARIIWDFGTKNQVEGGWRPLDSAIVQLKFWISEQDHLNQEMTRLSNRIHALELQTADLKKEIAHLRARIGQLREQSRIVRATIEKKIAQYPQSRDLLMSIPGIGPVTTANMIVLFHGNYQIDNARQAESLAGLSRRRNSSGTSLNKRSHISKMGSATLRKALFMAAMAASKTNPACKALYDRLVADNRPKKVALIAIACKLVRQAFGVLKSNIPFNPDLSIKNWEEKQAIA